MIDVVYLPHPGLDQVMLRDLLANKLWKPVNGYEYNETTIDKVTDGAVLVVPGAVHQARRIKDIIANWQWVVVIVLSDETNIFEIDILTHPNMKLWVQMPRADIEYSARYLPTGYGYAREYAPRVQQEYLNKKIDVFISGQNTHARRNVIFKHLYDYKRLHKDKSVHINETGGFTQGYSQMMYFTYLAESKVTPCPSGAFSPDSFRVYESLELGCVPIPDELSPKLEHNSVGYFEKIYTSPLPILKDDNINKHLKSSLSTYEQLYKQTMSWWIAQKRQYAYDIKQDIAEVTSKANIMKPTINNNNITVIIPVSVWKEHPNTNKLETTIKSIRQHLPTCEIIVTFDGVREEQKDRQADYNEFIKRMLWKINHEYTNILPIVFDEHTHQVGMARKALKYIKTPLILYVEGDSPLADESIEWQKITNKLLKDRADVVRLYNKAEIPEEHKYLMLSDVEDDFIKTAQWSQQPHIATTQFYKQALGYFGKEAKAFIEERIYYIGVKEARAGRWNMFIYKPDNTPRSYHLDGRENEDQFLESQVF